MKDWRTEIDRISRSLSIDTKADARAIDSFLNPDLHRNHFHGPVTETFGYSWVIRVYSILSAAAQDRQIDFHSLDEIYHGYSTNARALRAYTIEMRERNEEGLRDFVDMLPVRKPVETSRWQSRSTAK
jgi:hypothetical protein